jgi:hypothetical protein
MWMNWTKTSKRIPVWCLCVNDGEIKALVFNHKHMCLDDHSGDDYYCDIGEVPHWMPIPALPPAETAEGAKLQPPTTVDTIESDHIPDNGKLIG